MSSIAADAQNKGAKRTRGRSGCLNCRARRKKCDEVKPTCTRCRSCNDTCRWDEAFPFRSVGIGAEHPSMVQSRKNNPAALQIVDVSFENGRKRRKVTSANAGGHQSAEVESSHVNVENDTRGREAEHATGKSVPPSLTDDFPPALVNNQMNAHISVDRALSEQGTSSSTNFQVDHAEVHLDFATVDLGTLDYLTSHTSNIEMLASAFQTGDITTWSPETDFAMLSAGDSLSASSPDMYSMYYPNAQYRELHSTLHQHMVETARSTALAVNRQTSPESDGRGQSGPLPIAPSAPSDVGTRTTDGQRSNSSRQYLKCDLLTPRRQLELWRNYLDEIAPWLDMLDNNCHFQCTIPVMAKTAPHLHYSVLALSARQIERRSPEKRYSESLGLYQQAINMIVHRLQDLETDVIASCVLLCVLEMMSSSPRAWARHLDGCAMLMEAAGINGAVGGVGQAIFWCFARMDLWGGYLGDTLTKIPTNRWFIPSGSMAVAVSRFKEGGSPDTYANYAVFLCASVVNVISTREMTEAGKRIRSTDTPELYSSRWKALYDLLEDWYNDRPEGLLSLMNEQGESNDYQNPFPVVLYATSPGVAGNQMYHAAALLMLQHKPKEIRLPKSRKSILWHARQICGIATSNADHSAWTNALQPLWMAGKVMSHPSEHQAIIKILHTIEKETGFATEWRANDLKEYWGDESS